MTAKNPMIEYGLAAKVGGAMVGMAGFGLLAEGTISDVSPVSIGLVLVIVGAVWVLRGTLKGLEDGQREIRKDLKEGDKTKDRRLSQIESRVYRIERKVGVPAQPPTHMPADDESTTK